MVDAVGGRQDLVIVAQPYGAFTATLVASQLPVRLLVLLAGMIPAPGESPGEWWSNTGYRQAVEELRRGGTRTPVRHPRRGSRLSLRRAQPPEGTQRTSTDPATCGSVR